LAQRFTGTLELTGNDGRTTITLDGEHGGSVELKSSSDEDAIRLDAESCSLEMGGSQPGRLSLHDSLGRRTIRLDAATGYAQLTGLAEEVRVGGHGKGGSLYLVTADGESTIHLDAGASIELGGHGHYGSLYLSDGGNEKMISMYGRAGEIVLCSSPRTESIRLSGETGNLHLGGEGQGGDLFVQNKEGETTIHLDGETGAVHVPNADCAEDFAVAAGVELDAGDVVVFDELSALRPSAQPYDKRVAGVISGAGGTRPGIVLGRGRHPELRLPVALVGQVTCKVDAGFGAIEVGDLLTTSLRPGHAMKADDPQRAFGAVLGKALRSLTAGLGMIPVLVALR